jgi:pimeloyl-ACP methyl ester carboxylesterase
MVLLHGVTDTPRTWDLVRERLAAEHELFEPTLLGHSGGPAYAGDPSPDAIADQLERDLDAAGIGKAHLVGNSLGGAMALLLASRGRAETVVGLAPAGGWELDEAAGHRIRSFFTMGQHLVKEAAPRADAIASSVEGRRRALAFVSENTDHVPADLVAHQIRAAADCPLVLPLVELTTREGYDDVGPIEAPVRIVWGTEDKVLPWPEAGERFKTAIPHADWLIWEGVGHCPQIDVPDRTADAVLEFTSR